MKRSFKQRISFLLAIIMICTTLVGCATTPLLEEPAEQPLSASGTTYLEELTQSIATPLGMQEFADGWDSDPNAMVEIAVWFTTPPAVALRLQHEAEFPNVRAFSEELFEYQAQAAHDAFWTGFNQQIAGRARTAPQVEIISEHYWLFNGVYLRVPVYLIEQIAALPEVFAVMPKQEYELPDPIIYDMDMPIATDSNTDPLMAGTRALFDMDYIHNDLQLPGRAEPGLRGGQMRCNQRDPCGGCGEHTRPVRVAVLDQPINYAHPRLVPFQDPTTGRLRGTQFPVTPTASHGTQVAGALIAMAPDIELWCFPWGTAGVEAAHQANVDVMNRSITIGGLFSPTRYVINLAVLDGIVFVTGAGNSGHLGFFSLSGQAGLFLSAGSGQAGSDRPGYENRDGISDFSSRGPARGMFHIAPDILAPGDQIMTLDHSGNGYIMIGGTSFSTPVVAGIAALMVEAFPDASPSEIAARMMNTARQLSVQGDNSVFNIGAGFIQPYYALTTGNAFATVQNYIQWGDHTITGTFREESCSSLSFGAVAGRESVPLTITIHNPGSGTWMPDIRFNDHLHDHSGVSLYLLDSDSSGTAHTFTYQMRFADHVPRGMYEGNIVFTNATQSGQTITLPFGAYLGAEPIRMELTPNGDHDFGTMHTGEQPPAAHSVSLRNISDELLPFIFFGLTGSNADSFVLSTSSTPFLLPDQSANVTVRPREGLSVGTHTATVRIMDAFSHLPAEPPQLFNVSVTVVSDFAIELDPAGNHNFGTVAQGYPEQTSHSVTVRNTGSQATGNLSVNLTGSNAGSFTLSTASISNLAPDATTNFTVVPNMGLSPGTHTATVVVSGGNGISESFHVQFVVRGTPGSIQLNRDGVFEFRPYQAARRTGSSLMTTVRNTSTSWSDPLMVRLTGANASSFEFTHLQCSIPQTYRPLRDIWTGIGTSFVIPNIEPGGTTEFRLRVLPDLPAGTHTATVTVAGRGVSESFDLVIEVG